MKLMVAFSSPKRSAKTVDVASQYALSINAELVLVRVVPEAHQLGIVAELIATNKPELKAQSQIDAVVADLKAKGVNASGIVSKGAVAQGLVKAAKELDVSLLFVGTSNLRSKPRLFMAHDPIVHYLVDHCPISLCLIRNDQTVEQIVAAEAADGEK